VLSPDRDRGSNTPRRHRGSTSAAPLTPLPGTTGVGVGGARTRGGGIATAAQSTSSTFASTSGSASTSTSGYAPASTSGSGSAVKVTSTSALRSSIAPLSLLLSPADVRRLSMIGAGGVGGMGVAGAVALTPPPTTTTDRTPTKATASTPTTSPAATTSGSATATITGTTSSTSASATTAASASPQKAIQGFMSASASGYEQDSATTTAGTTATTTASRGQGAGAGVEYQDSEYKDYSIDDATTTAGINATIDATVDARRRLGICATQPRPETDAAPTFAHTHAGSSSTTRSSSTTTHSGSSTTHGGSRGVDNYLNVRSLSSCSFGGGDCDRSGDSGISSDISGAVSISGDISGGINDTINDAISDTNSDTGSDTSSVLTSVAHVLMQREKKSTDIYQLINVGAAIGSIGSSIGSTIGSTISNTVGSHVASAASVVGHSAHSAGDIIGATLPRYSASEMGDAMARKHSLLQELSKTCMLLGVSEQRQSTLETQLQRLRVAEERAEDSRLQSEHRYRLACARFESSSLELAGVQADRDAWSARAHAAETEIAVVRAALRVEQDRVVGLTSSFNTELATSNATNKTQADLYQTSIAKLEQSIIEMQQTSRLTQTNLQNALAKTVAELEGERGRHATNLNTWQSQFENMEQDQQQLRDELETTLLEASNRLATIEGEKSVLKREKSDLIDAISTASSGHIEETTRLRNSMHAQQEWQRGRDEEKDTEIASLRAVNIQLTSDFHDSERCRIASETAAAELTIALTAGTLSADELSRELEERQRERDALKADSTCRKEEIDRLMVELERYKCANLSISAEVTDLRQHKEAMTTKITSLARQISIAREEATASTDSWKNVVALLKVQLQEQEQVMLAYKAGVDANNSSTTLEVERTELAMEAARAEIDTLTEALCSVQRQVEREREEYASEVAAQQQQDKADLQAQQQLQAKSEAQLEAQLQAQQAAQAQQVAQLEEQQQLQQQQQLQVQQQLEAKLAAQLLEHQTYAHTQQCKLSAAEERLTDMQLLLNRANEHATLLSAQAIEEAAEAAAAEATLVAALATAETAATEAAALAAAAAVTQTAALAETQAAALATAEATALATTQAAALATAEATALATTQAAAAEAAAAAAVAAAESDQREVELRARIEVLMYESAALSIRYAGLEEQHFSLEKQRQEQEQKWQEQQEYEQQFQQEQEQHQQEQEHHKWQEQQQQLQQQLQQQQEQEQEQEQKWQQQLQQQEQLQQHHQEQQLQQHQQEQQLQQQAAEAEVARLQTLLSQALAEVEAGNVEVVSLGEAVVVERTCVETLRSAAIVNDANVAKQVDMLDKQVAMLESQLEVQLQAQLEAEEREERGKQEIEGYEQKLCDTMRDHDLLYQQFTDQITELRDEVSALHLSTSGQERELVSLQGALDEKTTAFEVAKHSYDTLLRNQESYQVTSQQTAQEYEQTCHQYRQSLEESAVVYANSQQALLQEQTRAQELEVESGKLRHKLETATTTIDTMNDTISKDRVDMVVAMEQLQREVSLLRDKDEVLINSLETAETAAAAAAATAVADATAAAKTTDTYAARIDTLSRDLRIEVDAHNLLRSSINADQRIHSHTLQELAETKLSELAIGKI
jgi:hypothetical protein